MAKRCLATEPNDHDWTPTTVQVDMGGYCERSEHFYPDRWQDTLNIDNVFWKGIYIHDSR